VTKTWKRKQHSQKVNHNRVPSTSSQKKHIWKSTATSGTLTQLKTILFKNSGDQKADWGRAISANIEECIGGVRTRSIMVEKWIDEIGRKEISRKQIEDGVSMMGSRNVGTNGGSLVSLDLAGGMLAKGPGRSREVECRRRHRRGRRKADRPRKASISDRRISRTDWRLRARN
jgi:hypothetical protein